MLATIRKNRYNSKEKMKPVGDKLKRVRVKWYNTANLTTGETPEEWLSRGQGK